MRLKTKLVVAITGLVFVLVTVLSALYLSQLLRQQVEQGLSCPTTIFAHQILFATRKRAGCEGQKPSRRSDKSGRICERPSPTALREDQGLYAAQLVIRYSPTVFDISIVDWNGRALLSTDVGEQDQLLALAPQFRRDPQRNLWHAASRVIFGKPRVYNVSLDLQRNEQRFLTVRDRDPQQLPEQRF